MSIKPLGTHFSEIRIEILTFLSKWVRLKMSSAKWLNNPEKLCYTATTTWTSKTLVWHSINVDDIVMSNITSLWPNKKLMLLQNIYDTLPANILLHHFITSFLLLPFGANRMWLSPFQFVYNPFHTRACAFLDIQFRNNTNRSNECEISYTKFQLQIQYWSLVWGF